MLLRPYRMAGAFAFGLMATAFVVLATVMFASNAAPTEASRTSDRLDAMNDFHDISWRQWGVRYDDLRTDPRYYWADWSQDGCSSPDWVPDFFTMDYPEACLRHDLTWRTLPVIDDGTGRVWNERNRWVADEKFRDDSLGACAYWYPNWQSGDLPGIPQIKPTFLDIAPAGIPPNIIPHSKGVKCGLMRPDSLKVPAFIGQPLYCQA